jgi:hypothetical protein
MILWHKHCDIFDAWLSEGVIYHTPGGISSLLTTYDSPISPLIRSLYPSYDCDFKGGLIILIIRKKSNFNTLKIHISIF